MFALSARLVTVCGGGYAGVAVFSQHCSYEFSRAFPNSYALLDEGASLIWESVYPVFRVRKRPQTIIEWLKVLHEIFPVLPFVCAATFSSHQSLCLDPELQPNRQDAQLIVEISPL